MARGRMLDKSISASYQINGLPDFACKLLATWLIAHLDKNGVFYGDAPMVRSQVFPLEEITNAQVEGYLQAMERATDGDGEPLMIRFTAQGRLWQFWPGFDRHQGGIRKDRERTTFPNPPTVARQQPGSSPAGDGQVGDELNLTQPNVTEPNSTEEEPAAAPIAATPAPSAAIDTWLKATGGAINPVTVDKINDAVDTCESFRLGLPRGSPGAIISGDEWVKEAILATIEAISKPRWSYTCAILDRWRAEGYKSKQKGANNGNSSKHSDVVDIQGHRPYAATAEEFYGSGPSG